jgi:hypothetical protein
MKRNLRCRWSFAFRLADRDLHPLIVSIPMLASRFATLPHRPIPFGCDSTTEISVASLKWRPSWCTIFRLPHPNWDTSRPSISVDLLGNIDESLPPFTRLVAACPTLILDIVPANRPVRRLEYNSSVSCSSPSPGLADLNTLTASFGCSIV